MMNIAVYFVCLTPGIVSGFLVQNGGSPTPDPQSSDQINIQNLYTLIVNEQTTRIQMQSEINELKTKLSGMSDRLGQMEHLNAEVTKQLTKEKNNREHLEEIIAALENSVLNLTLNNTRLQDKLVAMETNLNSKTDRISNMSNEIFTLKDVLKNITVNDVSVGFTVKDPDTSSGPPLKYKQLIYNTGNSYNISSGIFTCKYPGFYFFMVTMFKTPGIDQVYCYITVNGGGKIAVISGTGLTNAYQSGSASFIYRLQAGDEVSLSSCYGLDHVDQIASFTGFRIS